jgi:hypothetical protein
MRIYVCKCVVLSIYTLDTTLEEKNGGGKDIKQDLSHGRSIEDAVKCSVYPLAASVFTISIEKAVSQKIRCKYTHNQYREQFHKKSAVCSHC